MSGISSNEYLSSVRVLISVGFMCVVLCRVCIEFRGMYRELGVCLYRFGVCMCLLPGYVSSLGNVSSVPVFIKCWKLCLVLRYVSNVRNCI